MGMLGEHVLDLSSGDDRVLMLAQCILDLGQQADEAAGGAGARRPMIGAISSAV